jgi:hypothetical protein
MQVSKFIPAVATQKVSRAGLHLQKQSPHILFGVGLVSITGAVVLASRATLKLSATVQEFDEEVQHLNSIAASGRDKARAYAKHIGRIAKLYAPAALAVGIGVAALTCSHWQMTTRNNALTMAYVGLSDSFSKYRDRVKHEMGEERELEVFHAIEPMPDENGIEVRAVDVNKLSEYSRIFDELNPEYRKNAELNRLFIQCAQNYCNQLLQTRGHVFLNEVYDMLGFEHSSAGAIVGWVLGQDKNNFVNFGIFDAVSSRFINAAEPAVVLDFNVDGVIFNLI